MSVNAATEWHVNTKLDDDLSTTQDVDDGNVGHQDPCMSLEASVQGTSAKCAETTPVVLKSVLPHETQTKLHSSPPLTPRPPIEGKPNGCKQEAADSVVMAGRMKWTVETAEPQFTDIDRKAVLGGELAERVHRVNKGDKERKPQSQIQQIELYCKERRQHSGNATDNIPGTHGSLLVGEWEVCASGKTKNLIVDSPSESKVAEDTAGVKSRGRREGTSESECVDEADGSAGCGTEPVDMLITVSVQLEVGPSVGMGNPCGSWVWVPSGCASAKPGVTVQCWPVLDSVIVFIVRVHLWSTFIALSQCS